MKFTVKVKRTFTCVSPGASHALACIRILVALPRLLEIVSACPASFRVRMSLLPVGNVQQERRFKVPASSQMSAPKKGDSAFNDQMKRNGTHPENISKGVVGVKSANRCQVKPSQSHVANCAKCGCLYKARRGLHSTIYLTR